MPGRRPARPCSGLFRGTSLGGWTPNEHNFNLYTIVIGAQTLHAAGYAMGVVRDGAVGTGEPDRDTAVLAFFGDGASSQGDVNEAFVWAAAANLPVVFFCQNNQWAISEPVERADPGAAVPARGRASASRASGSTATTCWPAWRSPGRALDEARTGQGPTLIEAYTYRMGAHTTSDDPTRYRLGDELETWRLRGPDRAGAGLPGPRGRRRRRTSSTAIEAESEELAVRIRAGCRALPDPTPRVAVRPRVRRDARRSCAEQRAEFVGVPRLLRARGRMTAVYRC